jgi:SGNH domain (fused to AT3 domains)
VAFIAAGTVIRGAGTAAWFVANPLFRFIGRISFSLYLWHWPAVIFARAAFRDGSSARTVVPIAATVALSIVSYYAVERAVLDAAARRRVRRSGDKPVPAPRHERIAQRNERTIALAIASVGALVCVGAVASYPTHQVAPPLVALPLSLPPDGSSAPASSGPTGSSGPTAPSIVTTPAPRDVGAIVDAVNASSWSSSVRSQFDSLGGAGAPEWIKDHCLDVDAANQTRCQYGATRPTHTALLLGDSKAISYLPGLITALAPAGWRIQVLTWDRCPVALVDVGTGGSEAQDCHNHHTYLHTELPKLHPQLVIMADNSGIMPRVGGTDPFQTMSKALAATIALLPPTARRVIVSDPPGSKSLQSCVTATSGPRDCMGTEIGAWHSYYAMQVAVGSSTSTQVLDLENQFCYQRYCPAVIGGQPVYFDGAHLTETFSKSLAPIWRTFLANAH